MKRTTNYNLPSSTKVAIPSFLFLAATAIRPSYAGDNGQHDATMEARI